MKNKEKFAKEIIDIAIENRYIAFSKEQNKICGCSEICCNDCLFSRQYNNEENCKNVLKKWFESEYVERVKLTSNEKAILESIDKKYQWIARSSDGGLVIYSVKPLKGKKTWRIIEPAYINSMNIFNPLFQFIKWEDDEPYNIAELLKNCEVVENE